ncbi:MAG TPA: hypothetical protein VGI60_00370 [Chthoniobacterales bacterium]|jgi:hypothetical protein
MSRFLIFVLIVTGCSTPPPVSRPAARLEVPADFQTAFQQHQFQKDDAVSGKGRVSFTAGVPLTRYQGNWGPITNDIGRNHDWWIDVYAGLSKEILLVCTQAKDGYETPFDDSGDLFSPWPPELHNGHGGSGYFCARFEQKHFRWGDGISLLSQDVDDTHPPGPMNGALRYKVWAVSRNHRFTVFANFAVTHPKLDGWVAMPDEFEKDPRYILIQSCPADEFQPSLTVVDRMIDSLDFK